MLVPIFGSCPTYLNPAQDASRRLILGELNRAGLEWRSLGQTDYPSSSPLTEVFVLARHCAGGVILGFSQFEAAAGVSKKGTEVEKRVRGLLRMPTPWNHLEAGILFALNKPLLVFREPAISGGIFDNGVTDLFIHTMPHEGMTRSERKAFREIVRKYATEVHGNYYHR